MNSHGKRQAGRTGPWLQALMALILGAMLLAAGPARAATETITYIHGDISGSPLAATNATGAVVWKESYRAYGERWVNDPGSAQQSQWFHGKEQDAATGLQYFGARYYDPAVGRFLGIDPVDYQDGNLHSFNRYAYGNNNPVRYVDPNGQWAEDALLALPGMVVGSYSLVDNIKQGNWTGATVDLGGLIADGVALALPGVPGGAGLAIKAAREGAEVAATKTGGVWRSSKIDSAKMEHIFSADHIQTGIMDLGRSKDAILGQARDALLTADKSGGLREGMNTVVTKMNGHDATVRAFFKNGEMQSMNLFKGTSDRAGQYVIDLR